MASRRMTVHLQQQTLDALALGDSSVSSRINEVVRRYREILLDARPDFTRAQWCAVCDALNGIALLVEVGADPVPDLWLSVADAPGLGEKWAIDQSELVGRLQAASRAELAAIYEVVRVFWQHADKPANEALALALK